MGGCVFRVLIVVLCLALGLGLTGVAQAQAEHVIFEGTVVDAEGQPGVGRLVVIFLNGREVGRAEAECQAGVCRFEVVIADESGVGVKEADGLTHVQVNELKVGKPFLIQGRSTTPGQRANYAVIALADTVDRLPERLKQGRLVLFPDGGVAVFEDTRPPDLPRPAPRAPVAQTGPAPDFPLWPMALLAVTCCGSLVMLAVLGGLAFFIFRQPTVQRQPEPVPWTPPFGNP